MSNRIFLPLVIALALAIPFLTSNTYFHHLMVLWMLFSLLALSLNVIIGYIGELSFGHAAFFGICAYTAAIVGMNFGLAGIPGLLLAAFMAGLFGFVIGYVSLRIVGPQFAILTLGFGSIIYTITNYWVDLTRGPMGISNIQPLGLWGEGGVALSLVNAAINANDSDGLRVRENDNGGIDVAVTNGTVLDNGSDGVEVAQKDDGDGLVVLTNVTVSGNGDDSPDVTGADLIEK